MSKDFWSDATVAVLGGGSWGTVLAGLISSHCRQVRLWLRNAEVVKSINTTRLNPTFSSEFVFNERVHAFQDLERALEVPVQLVLWVLPSHACRGVAKQVAPFLKGHELIVHAVKGLEEKTGYRMSQVLAEELPCRRLGVLGGPNLAQEVAQGEPTATVVASPFPEVREAVQALLSSSLLEVKGLKDHTGLEWAGVLKNPLAMAMGGLEALGLGCNTRAFLLTRGFSEMVSFGTAFGGEAATFFSYAGLGDLWATCSSSQSRNYQLGFRLAQGKTLQQALEASLGVVEGLSTLRWVVDLADQHGLDLPTYRALRAWVFEQAPFGDLLKMSCSLQKTF